MVTIFETITALLGILPFGIVGIAKTVESVANKIKVRMGYFKVIKKLPNDRLKIFWVKPEATTIRFKDHLTGEEINMKIETGKDWVYFNGDVPTIFLDQNNNQIQLGTRVSTIPFEQIKAMYSEAYHAGKLAGLTQFSKFYKQLQIMIFIIMLVSVGTLVATVFLK